MTEKELIQLETIQESLSSALGFNAETFVITVATPNKEDCQVLSRGDIMTRVKMVSAVYDDFAEKLPKTMLKIELAKLLKD